MSEIPQRITDDQYNLLMRRIWEMEQIMGNYQMDCNLRDQVDSLVQELFEVRKENRYIKKMLVKIGTALFKKATDGTKSV